MSTAFTWSTRLLDAAGAAAAGAELAVEIYDLARNKWAPVSTARTGATGVARGKGEIADDTLPFAPAMRLVDGQAIMSTTPDIKRAARGLNVDFGQVQRSAATAAFIRTGGRGDIPFVLGGGSTGVSAIDPDKIRLELTRDFEARLTLRDREVAERDTRIADLDRTAGERLTMVRQKDAEITRLRSLLDTSKLELAEALRPRGTSAASSIMVNSFATNIGNQLDEAQVELKSRGFSLGAIEVNAKALLQDQGRRIEFPDSDTLKALPAGSLADVKLSFRPDAPPPGVPPQTVPDLMFLTESRARAVLASLGLALEASRGPRALNRDAAPGQAMLQTPGPGAPLARGGRVHIIFAPDAATPED